MSGIDAVPYDELVGEGAIAGSLQVRPDGVNAIE